MKTNKETLIKNSTSKNTFSEDIISCKDYVDFAYETYGRDIMGSSFQQGRQFLDMYDGLKISYRHILQTLLDQPENQFVKTHAIIGDNMKKIHFHGDGGAENIIYSLANDYKCVEIQGNSGSRTMELEMPGSAGRYTEARLKATIREQLKHLMPFVPEELTFTGYPEKRYIPTPIPLGVVAGASGMGIGFAHRIPAFTAASMYQAWLKNDPTLLRLNYGYSLGDCYDSKSYYEHITNKIKGKNLADQEPISENKANLKKIWEQGEGRLTLGIPIYNTEIEGKQGFLLVCDPALGTPKKSEKIQQWEKEGLIEVSDLSDTTGKLFFALQPRVRRLSKEELLEEIKAKCNVFIKNPLVTSYSFNVAQEKDGKGFVSKIGLYDWITFTHSNYTKLYQKYIDDALVKLDREELLWYSFQEVVSLLTDRKNPREDKDVVEIVNSKLSKGSKEDKAHLINIEIVKQIGEKAFNTYRTANPTKKLENIAKQRKLLKELVIEDKIAEYVQAWT